MAYISDNSLDALLNDIKNNATKLYLCSAEPATYAEASESTGYALGNSTDFTITGPTTGDVSGRKLDISSISSGTITSTGTATYFALVDSGDTELMVTRALSGSQALTSTSNTFSLTAWDIEIPDPST